ncbi:MAG: SLC13 family permease [Methanomicrobiales archaeon]
MDIQILLVLAVLTVTIVLLVTEALRVDLVAAIIMVSLAWLGLVPPLQAFSGLASNAVIAMAAVMVLGYGIDRTGVMAKISQRILSVAGTDERRITASVSLTVGALSGFMQNIGATALFLPAMLRLSRQSGIPVTRLLMPMGFAAILGGTLTMVGSGPLIILNDLLRQNGLAPFGLFAVTPVGIVLLLSGVGLFYLLGSRLFHSGERRREDEQESLMLSWDLPSLIRYVRVPEQSALSGISREESGIGMHYPIHLLALEEEGEIQYAPWRHTRFRGGQILALLGERDDIERFAHAHGLEDVSPPDRLARSLGGDQAGFAEIVVRPRSAVVGETIRELAFRRTYGLEPLLLISGDEELRSDFSDHRLNPGDIIVVHGLFDQMRRLEGDRQFVLLTPVRGDPLRRSRAPAAVGCLLGAIALTFSGFPISLSLLTGAVAMVLLRVITLEEVYRAIDWRTVILIAGLIPLGLAMDTSGAAAYLASGLVDLLAGQPAILLLLVVALLAMFFSLFMSNVAATVLLVPLVVVMAEGSGIDPRALALLVAVSAANSFILPTHQVNALIMGPGGYRNRDYMRAGLPMSVVFLVASVGLFYILLL